MKSWKGMPVTNVVTNWDLDLGWSKSYCTSIQWNDYEPPAGIYSPVVSFIDADSNGNGYWYSYGNYAPQDPSTTYSISVYARTVGAPWSIRAYTADNAEVGRQYTESITVPGDGSWYRLEFVPITTPSNTQSDSLSFQFTVIPAGQRCWLCAPQMTATGFHVPYVAGTRSATQAILDFTNNRTITASDLTYNNDNTFTFDGTNDVILTDFPAQTLQTSTLEAVVYDTKNNGAYRSIIQINTNTDDALYINPSNNLQFWPATASSLQVPANQWNYVCAAYNGSSILYCVNGEFQEIAGASLDFTNYQFLRIGGHSTGDGERFKGQIPIARVYNRALTRSEMLQNYSAFRGRFGI
jgi:hypothetical protein